MALIRVLEMPRGDGNFRFGAGAPQTFVEVDWFRDDIGPSMATFEGRADIEVFIRKKNYFKAHTPYLVLHQDASFTIGYSAP